MSLSFHTPAGLVPYDDAAAAQRRVDDARRTLQDAVRRAHGEYMQAWTSYAPDELVSILDLIQRRTKNYADDLLERVEQSQALLDEAAANEGGRAFSLRHSAMNNIDYTDRSIESTVEMSKSARNVSMLRFSDDDDDDDEDIELDYCDLRVTVAGNVAEAHERLRAARIGTDYGLMSTDEPQALHKREALISLSAPEGTLASATAAAIKAARQAGFEIIGVEEN
jgi:hypothetical protein